VNIEQNLVKPTQETALCYWDDSDGSVNVVLCGRQFVGVHWRAPVAVRAVRRQGSLYWRRPSLQTIVRRLRSVSQSARCPHSTLS